MAGYYNRVFIKYIWLAVKITTSGVLCTVVDIYKRFAPIWNIVIVS